MIEPQAWAAAVPALRASLKARTGLEDHLSEWEDSLRRRFSGMLWYFGHPGASWPEMPERFGRHPAITEETLRFWMSGDTWQKALEAALGAVGRDPAEARAVGMLAIPPESRQNGWKEPHDSDPATLLTEGGELKEAAWRAMRPLVLFRYVSEGTRRRWNALLYLRLGFTNAEVADRFASDAEQATKGLRPGDLKKIEAWSKARERPLTEGGDWRELSPVEMADLVEQVPGLLSERNAEAYSQAPRKIAELIAANRQPKFGTPLRFAWPELQAAAAEAVDRAEHSGGTAPGMDAQAWQPAVLGLAPWLRLRNTLRESGRDYAADQEMFQALDALVAFGHKLHARGEEEPRGWQVLSAEEPALAQQVRTWRQSGVWPTLRWAHGIGPGLAWLDEQWAWESTDVLQGP